MRYVILAQSEVTARALGAWLELLGQQPMKDDDPRRIVWSPGTVGGLESGVLDYESLCRRLERAIDHEECLFSVNEVTVLVDSVRPAQMSAISEATAWDSLLAMLILTFPELRWVFGVIGKSKATEGEPCFPEPEHNLPSLLCRARRCSLLDGTGLREWVRRRTNEVLRKQLEQHPYLPMRDDVAAAIDEERGYAYFHGHVAYRFGFRADAVTSWALMRERFRGKEEVGEDEGHGYALLFEDMSLHFPDRGRDVHLLHLSETGPKGKDARAELCSKLGYDGSPNVLENSRYRFLVTTGQSGADANALEENRRFLRRHKPGKSGVVLKPVGGMFNLWERTRLKRRLRNEVGDHERNVSAEERVTRKRRRGFADGFAWPPAEGRGEESSGHGAPGKLALIAQVLVRRAERWRDEARTVKDFIRGAVMAIDAAELLGCRTPTSTLHALQLKHEYEVRSECAFVGVGNHVNVRDRIREIRHDIAAVARWFDRRQRKAAALDAEIAILNRIVMVFREAGHFDEEMECLVSLRWCHRRLRWRQRQDPIAWLGNGILAYAEWLMSSFRGFAGAIALWLIGSVVMARFVLEGASSSESATWAAAVKLVADAFFGGSLTNDAGMGPLLFSCAIVATGFFHLGVFVSYLYSMVSRR